ncbi:unnamed protein product [Gadus morhua 'NCC']
MSLLPSTPSGPRIQHRLSPQQKSEPLGGPLCLLILDPSPQVGAPACRLETRRSSEEEADRRHTVYS